MESNYEFVLRWRVRHRPVREVRSRLGELCVNNNSTNNATVPKPVNGRPDKLKTSSALPRSMSRTGDQPHLIPFRAVASSWPSGSLESFDS
jgi:hypothetical protein